MALRSWKNVLVVFLAYYVLLFAGAAIIMYIEAEGLQEAKHAFSNVTEPLKQLFEEEFSIVINNSDLEKILLIAQDIAAQQKKTNKLKWKRDISWATLYKWRYFTHTTLTTVGFGDIVPDTDGGRIFVIIYSIIGIPLNILVTTAIGFLLSASLSKLIRQIESSLFQARESRHVELKTLVLLVIMCFGWLSIGARMTLTVMDWSWLEGYYAVFVKFSTIGYGDYSLDFSKVHTYWEVLSWYTNIGLAIVTGIFDALTQWMQKQDQQKTAKADDRTARIEMNEKAS